MKYALFAAPYYYPGGGWLDFVCAGTLNECKASADVIYKKEAGSYFFQIVDLELKKMVLESNITGANCFSLVFEWAEVI